MGNWKEVSEEKIRIVFEKDCDCPVEVEGQEVQFVNPIDLVMSGVPICGFCGEAYSFDKVLFEAN